MILPAQPTQRQRECLEAIVRLTRENRAPPTIREIGAAMCVSSPNAVLGFIQRLQKLGLLETPKGRLQSRGIRLANQETCPCCGQKIAKESR